MAPMAQVNDPRSLQELAVDVMQDIHKLTTGLAHAGVAPKVTNEIEATTELFGQIAKALAAGPVGAQSASGQPGEAPGGAAAPSGQATAPPGPQTSQAPQGPGTPAVQPPSNRIGGNSPQGPAYGDLHNTIAQMHHDSVNAVARTGR